jgi:hypothetical protein
VISNDSRSKRSCWESIDFFFGHRIRDRCDDFELSDLFVEPCQGL